MKTTAAFPSLVAATSSAALFESPIALWITLVVALLPALVEVSLEILIVWRSRTREELLELFRAKRGQ